MPVKLYADSEDRARRSGRRRRRRAYASGPGGIQSELTEASGSSEPVPVNRNLVDDSNLAEILGGNRRETVHNDSLRRGPADP